MSVVVPVRADARVCRLLDSLRRQTLSPGRFEVIVVENGSSVLEPMGRWPDVHYLRLPVSSPPAARNAGLRAARGRWVLMTDADCVAAEDWIERIVQVLSSCQASAVGGRIEKHKPESLVQRYGITVVDGQRTLNYLPALHLPYVVSANVGYNREDLVAVGGFNERLLSGSDVDICYRLGLAGHGIELAPDAVIYHDDRRTVRDHFSRFAHYAQFQVLLFALYRPVSGKRFVINPYPWRRVGGALVRFPSALLNLIIGRPSNALEVLLQLVEAAGVWWGDLRGSLKYRQIYL